MKCFKNDFDIKIGDKELKKKEDQKLVIIEIKKVIEKDKEGKIVEIVCKKEVSFKMKEILKDVKKDSLKKEIGKKEIKKKVFEIIKG